MPNKNYLDNRTKKERKQDAKIKYKTTSTMSNKNWENEKGRRKLI